MILLSKLNCLSIMLSLLVIGTTNVMGEQFNVDGRGVGNGELFKTFPGYECRYDDVGLAKLQVAKDRYTAGNTAKPEEGGFVLLKYLNTTLGHVGCIDSVKYQLGGGPCWIDKNSPYFSCGPSRCDTWNCPEHQMTKPYTEEETKEVGYYKCRCVNKPTEEPEVTQPDPEPTPGICGEPRSHILGTCHSMSCAYSCVLPQGYYPDLTNTQAYCKCTGHPRIPSRWNVCPGALVWDVDCSGQYAMLDGYMGAAGGCCNYKYNVDKNKVTWTDNVRDNYP